MNRNLSAILVSVKIIKRNLIKDALVVIDEFVNRTVFALGGLKR